jgi:hypothetical protein
MTKKHFIAAAKLISALADQGKISEANAAANVVICMNDNPAFDKEKFLRACNIY